MEINTKTDWLKNLKPGLIKFLEKMDDERYSGFYKYTLSGDLCGPNIHWGLANSVFATKIYYMIDAIDKDRKKKISSFILSFQKNDGYINDPFIRKQLVKFQLTQFIRNKNIFNYKSIFNKNHQVAETRQAIAALVGLDEKPKYPLLTMPKNKIEVEKYLESLDWNNPWGAGSHFGHLLFFLYYNRQLFNHDENEDLIDYAITWVNKFQSEGDGCWYKKDISNQLKINGAMKILIGLRVAHKLNTLRFAEKIIDTCLTSINNQEACSHFNVICVLYECNCLTNYRDQEIKEYALNKLDSYKEYYYPEIGGFSFNKNKSGTHYLGAKISKGLDEPDIHGTVMFLWGITLISKILNLDLGLREPIT
jgi:hypothetical protein